MHTTDKPRPKRRRGVAALSGLAAVLRDHCRPRAGTAVANPQHADHHLGFPTYSPVYNPGGHPGHPTSPTYPVPGIDYSTGPAGLAPPSSVVLKTSRTSAPARSSSGRKSPGVGAPPVSRDRRSSTTRGGRSSSSRSTFPTGD